MSARLVALIACLIFLAPVGQCAFAEQAEVRGVFYLKVRSAPDFEAAEAGVLAEGDVVDIIGEVGRWANVALQDGTTGYVSRKYLVLITGTARRAEQPEEDSQKTDSADVAEAEDSATPLAEVADSPTPLAEVVDSPPPPEKPKVSVTATTRLSTPGTPVCTSNDIEKIQRELRKLVAAQDRLVELMEGDARTEPAARDWSSSLSTRQMLFWLAVGCAVGWLASVGLRQRRERRQRNRIRI